MILKKDTGDSNKLRQAAITVIDNKECGTNSDNVICAGDSFPIVHDSCQGDSGGPFSVKKGMSYYLVGIVR